MVLWISSLPSANPKMNQGRSRTQLEHHHMEVNLFMLLFQLIKRCEILMIFQNLMQSWGGGGGGGDTLIHMNRICIYFTNFIVNL